MNRITGMTRRCVDDYMMIEAGDRIAVGLSGGKDSIALLAALHSLKRYYPKEFELSAITRVPSESLEAAQCKRLRKQALFLYPQKSR